MMTEEERTVLLRISKENIVKENDKSIWIDLGQPDDVIRMVMMSIANPDRAVVRKDSDEDVGLLEEIGKH